MRWIRKPKKDEAEYGFIFWPLEFRLGPENEETGLTCSHKYVICMEPVKYYRTGESHARVQTLFYKSNAYNYKGYYFTYFHNVVLGIRNVLKGTFLITILTGGIFAVLYAVRLIFLVD